MADSVRGGALFLNIEFPFVRPKNIRTLTRIPTTSLFVSGHHPAKATEKVDKEL